MFSLWPSTSSWFRWQLNLEGIFVSPLVLFYFLAVTSWFSHHLWSRKALTCSFGSGHSPTHLYNHSAPFLTLHSNCTELGKVDCFVVPCLYSGCSLGWEYLIPMSTWRIATRLLRNIFTLSLFQALANSEQNRFLPCGAHVLVCECRGWRQKRNRQEDTKHVK